MRLAAPTFESDPNEYLVRRLTSSSVSSSSIAYLLSQTSKHWEQGKGSQDLILRKLCLPTYYEVRTQKGGYIGV